jgi:hypothetical protein
MWKGIKKFAKHPSVNLVVGLVLVGTAVVEIAEDAFGEVTDIGAEHGVLVVGLLHVLRSLPELVDGMSKVAEARERPE